MESQKKTIHQEIDAFRSSSHHVLFLYHMNSLETSVPNSVIVGTLCKKNEMEFNYNFNTSDYNKKCDPW